MLKTVETVVIIVETVMHFFPEFFDEENSVPFDQLNLSLLNKSCNFFFFKNVKKKTLLTPSQVFLFVSKYKACFVIYINNI